MGTRGPIPKREDQRVRRNKDEIETTTVIPVNFSQINQPPLAIDDPHPLVTDFYYSLGESAQAQFYEPSDWQYARVVMHTLNEQIRKGQISAVMFASLTSALSNLLVTEGDRRRVRMEVDRGAGQTEDKTADVASIYRERLSSM